MDSLLIPTIILTVVGVVSAIVLYVVSRRFAVEEDERVAMIEELLPGANCGSCGCSGCHGFAVRCVEQGGLGKLSCPGAGSENMARIAGIFGQTASAETPKVAVLRCAGECSKRHVISTWNGPSKCSVMSAVSSGYLSCAFGCLQCGDCVSACSFSAIRLDHETSMPVVDDEKCVGCGACVDACPRSLIELRNKGIKNRRVYVACSNKQRGAVARKECDVACIGCGKCAKTCPFEAITIVDNLAYIDYNKCKLCRKCVAVCPTGAILAVNFPVINNIPTT